MPGCCRDPAVRLVPVRLHCQRVLAGRAQQVAEQLQALGEARADHDAVRGDDDAAGAGQVFGEGLPQREQAARTGVASEVTRGCRRQRPPGGGKPGGSREGRHIGQARPQVVPHRGRRGAVARRACARDTGGPLGDPRPGAVPGVQPALGDELGVGVGDRVPREAEVTGERARRRQRCPRRQPAAADGVPQRGLQSGPRPGPRQLEVEVETGGSGPRSLHRIGS